MISLPKGAKTCAFPAAGRGVDPPKRTHTATAVDPATNADLGSIRIEATLSGYKRLIAWAKQWPQRRWAVENAQGLGRHLTRWLIGCGETVVDVPTTATARVRELSPGSRRKNDRIDDACAPCVAALQGEGRPVVSDEHADALRMLDERRNNLSASRTRTINQLHTLIGQLHLKGAIIEIEPARYQLSTADLRRCWIPRRALVAATSNTGATLRNGLGLGSPYGHRHHVPALQPTRPGAECARRARRGRVDQLGTDVPIITTNRAGTSSNRPKRVTPPVGS
nr:transposase [Nocardia abscessus]